MNILLMGLEFKIGNKGCEALSYSFAGILKRISKNLNIKLELTALVYSPTPQVVKITDELEVRCINVKFKDMKFWISYLSEIKKCHLVIDFTMGDSFSDIYGVKRFFKTSIFKQIALIYRKELILGPQTYGPYENKLCRLWGKSIISKSRYVFTRDKISLDYVQNLCNCTAYEVTDIAFELPYKQLQCDKDGLIHIGFNPSGLLWAGGYSKNNQFGLSVEYKDYCIKLLSMLCDNDKYIIYLIPHVWDNDLTKTENDLAVCYMLKELFPKTTVVSDLNTAMDVKSVIASMDIFIGARMHATIAALSSGVVTIPFSYSRKFQGLFTSLNYPYIVAAQHISIESAIELTIRWINDYRTIHENVIQSNELIKKKQEEFNSKLEFILEEMELRFQGY